MSNDKKNRVKIYNIFLTVGEHVSRKYVTEISDFIVNLNRIYEKNNISFNLILDNQEEQIIKTDITDSKIFIALFGTEVSERTKKVLSVAYKSFIDSKKPKIATYIQEAEKHEKQTEKFMKKLTDELGVYYTYYSNIDTIKFNLIIQINALVFENVELLVKERKSINK